MDRRTRNAWVGMGLFFGGAGAVIPVFDHLVVHGSPDESEDRVVERNSSLVGGMDIVFSCPGLRGEPSVLRVGRLDDEGNFDTSQGFVYSRDTPQGRQTRFKGVDSMGNPLAGFAAGYDHLSDVIDEVRPKCPNERLRVELFEHRLRALYAGTEGDS